MRRLGRARFTAAVRRELPRWGATRPCRRIINAVFDALADPVGVTAHCPGGPERAQLVLLDWQHTRRRLRDVEARMVEVVDDLGVTGLVTSIDGLTAVGAATLLAETGDLTRFRSPRAVVKHAGLCPRDQRQRRPPGQDVSVWSRTTRAASRGMARGVGALPNNPVLAARFHHLTTRADNRLAPKQARAACAAALLRWLQVVVTGGVRWNPAIAAGETPQTMAA